MSMNISNLGQVVLVGMIALVLALEFAVVLIPLAFLALSNFTADPTIAANNLSTLFTATGVMGIVILGGFFLAILVIASFGMFGKGKGR